MCLFLILLIVLLILGILYLLSPLFNKYVTSSDVKTDSITLILGSGSIILQIIFLGGHTSELLLLLKEFDFEKNGISIVHAVIGSDGDILSEKKLLQQPWVTKTTLKARNFHSNCLPFYRFTKLLVAGL